jgi:hypothetical protein
MLAKLPFYYQTTKKLVIAVGSLFSSIYCVSKDPTGVTKKIVTVPLAYLNKEKFIVRLQQAAAMNEHAEITLPRMSYEIVGMSYDPSRQLNKVNKVNGIKDDRGVYSYSPVPYNLSFNLYSFTRTIDDNYQIMEQIVPYFTPDMNLSIKIMQNPDVIQNCSLTLNSVGTDDQYDGAFEDRQHIISTYSFSLKMNYYGPIFGIDDPEKHFQDSNPVSIIKKVEINLNNNKYTATIDPFSANATDNYTIDETQWSPPTNFDSNRTL